MPRFQIGDIVMTTALANPIYYLIEDVDDSCYHWRLLGRPTLPYAVGVDRRSTGVGLQKVFDSGSLEFVKVA